MAHHSQMLWDIPPLDSFRVLSEIYGVPPAEFRQTRDELIDLLDMGELLVKPVRNLSLGERMKCELVAGLRGVEITEHGPNHLTLRVARIEAPAVTAHLLQTLPVADLVVEDLPIEAVIDQIYQEGGV